MPAAGQKNTRLPRRLNGAAQVHARLRPARPLAQTRHRIQPDDDHRLAPAFAQAPGDDADHAGVPVLTRDDDQGCLVGVGAGRLDAADGGLRHGAFDLAARQVQGVQLQRQGLGLCRIVGRQ